MPPSIRVMLAHLGEGEPADLDRPRLDRRRTARRPSSAFSIAFSAVHGRAEWPLTPWKVIRAFRLPRQPAWIVAVGRLEQDRELRLVHDARVVEEVRERAELGRQLLLAEREQREVDLRLDAALVELARELEHDREPALHVAGAEPDDGAVLDPAGHVLLRRHGVVVACEHDERLPFPPRPRPDEGVLRLVLRLERGRHERADVRGDLRLVPALGAECSRARACARPAGREVGHRPQAWHNPGSDDAAEPRLGRRARARARSRRPRHAPPTPRRSSASCASSPAPRASSRSPSSCSSARIPIRARTSARASSRS